MGCDERRLADALAQSSKKLKPARQPHRCQMTHCRTRRSAYAWNPRVLAAAQGTGSAADSLGSNGFNEFKARWRLGTKPRTRPLLASGESSELHCTALRQGSLSTQSGRWWHPLNGHQWATVSKRPAVEAKAVVKNVARSRRWWGVANPKRGSSLVKSVARFRDHYNPRRSRGGVSRYCSLVEIWPIA